MGKIYCRIQDLNSYYHLRVLQINEKIKILDEIHDHEIHVEIQIFQKIGVDEVYVEHFENEKETVMMKVDLVEEEIIGKV